MWSPCTHSTNCERAGADRVARRIAALDRLLVDDLAVGGEVGEERPERRLQVEDGHLPDRSRRPTRSARRARHRRWRSSGRGCARSVYFTSAEVNFSPLWKVALVTRLNVQVLSSICVPRGGEVGHELAGGVDVDELAEDVLVDLGAGVDRRGRRVEHVGLAGEGGAQVAAVLDVGGHRGAAGRRPSRRPSESAASVRWTRRLRGVVEAVDCAVACDFPPVTDG